MRALFVVFICALVPVAAVADDGSSLEEATAAPGAQQISLAEVLQVSVRQSPTLEDAAIDVAVAEASIREATGIEDWLLSATGSVFLQRDEPVEGDFIGSNAVDVYSTEVSISKLLSTGATVSVTADGQRQRRVLAGIMDPIETTSYNTGITASVSQPLLRGRGEKPTRAARIRAEIAKDAAQLAKESEARTLVRDIVLAYWEVAFAHRALEISKASLELANERRRLTQQRVELGNAAPTELTAVDQIIATREEEVLGAELTISERSLDLRRLAGLEIGPTNIDLQTAEIVAAEPTDIDLDSVVNKAYENSPELAALAARGKGATLDVEVTENGLLPKLDLTVSAGPVGTAEKPSDAIKNMAQFKGYQIAGSLSFSHSLGNNSAEGSKMRANEELRRIEVSDRDLRAQIAVAAVRAVKSARSATRRMELSTTAIELSEKNIEAEQRRFELGRSTNFDVLQRQDELKQARLRFARASVDYLRAQALIDALTGEVLPKYGISFDDQD